MVNTLQLIARLFCSDVLFGYFTCLFSALFFRIILPIMQSYSYAGAFTVKGKIKTALYENALWYGSYLIIFGILLIYVILKPGLQVDA